MGTWGLSRASIIAFFILGIIDTTQAALKSFDDVDCTIRQLALQYAQTLLPDRGSFQEVADALRLDTLCPNQSPHDVTPAQKHPQSSNAPGTHPTNTIPVNCPGCFKFVDSMHGDDEWAGNITHPVQSIQLAADACASHTLCSHIVLRPGTHFLISPMVFGHKHSHLHITTWEKFSAACLEHLKDTYKNNQLLQKVQGIEDLWDVAETDRPSGNVNPAQLRNLKGASVQMQEDMEDVQMDSSISEGWEELKADEAFRSLHSVRHLGKGAVIISGGVPLTKLKWKQHDSNTFVASVRHLHLPPFSSLYVNGHRAIRARYPNGNPETTGHHTKPTGLLFNGTTWLSPLKSPPAVEIHIRDPLRNNSFFQEFQWCFGGPVASFQPPSSYWGCKAPQGGAAHTYAVPPGFVSSDPDFVKRAKKWGTPTTAIVHAFHGMYWGNWVFEVKSLTTNDTAATVMFGRGGFQEARGRDRGGEWYVENVREELDSDNEWYLDTEKQLLYYRPNATEVQQAVEKNKARMGAGWRGGEREGEREQTRVQRDQPAAEQLVNEPTLSKVKGGQSFRKVLHAESASRAADSSAIACGQEDMRGTSAHATGSTDKSRDSHLEDKNHVDHMGSTAALLEYMKSVVLVAGHLKKLLVVQGSQHDPVKDFTIEGVAFTETDVTFMDDYMVPSGGDWSIHRGAAVMLEGVEGARITNCTFTRLGGNALLVGGYAKSVTIERNEFSWLGDSAIVLLGNTDLMDGTAGNVPDGTIVQGNVIREVGVYGKQTGAVFQSLSRRTVMSNNVMFNGPRSGINLNDGFGGGNVIERNLLFNWVRETGDHGPINTWDRLPYLIPTESDKGYTLIPEVSQVRHNFLISTYHASFPFDTDDGSCYYNASYNLMAYGAFKDYLGHSNVHTHNVYLFPDMIWKYRRDFPSLPQGFSSAGNPYCAFSKRAVKGQTAYGHVYANNTCVMFNSSTVYMFGGADFGNGWLERVPSTSANTFYTAGPAQMITGDDQKGRLSWEAYRTHGVDEDSVNLDTASLKVEDIVLLAKNVLPFSG